jgi:hypothetical protein
MSVEIFADYEIVLAVIAVLVAVIEIWRRARKELPAIEHEIRG